jgi:glucose-6-phosphate isomerase
MSYVYEELFNQPFPQIKPELNKKLKTFFDEIIKLDNPYKAFFDNAKTENLTQELFDIADDIRKSKEHVVIIGMGGATLNPQAITCLKSQSSSPKIHFLESTDPLHFYNIMEGLPLGKTCFITISKSGNTVETISLLSAVINFYKARHEIAKAENFIFILGKQDSPTLKLAKQLEAKIFLHNEGVGGRFSTFTNVGLLPGLIAGLNMNDFLEGMVEVKQDFLANQLDSKPIKSALNLVTSGENIVVNLSYIEAFLPVLKWYSQIQAESLGKMNKGITPIYGLGPNDQHSMLQLYLDGPKDKIFTFINVQNYNLQKAIKTQANIEPEYIANTTLQEIHNTFFQATIKALVEKDILIRRFTLQALDEKSLGAFLMHIAIETIMVGCLLEINPFDQPAVEQIKINSRNILINKKSE